MDRQVDTVFNLPPLSITEINDAISAASRDGSTVSLVSTSSEEEGIVQCFTGEDAQPTINIINSSDVVIGSVTQFHGPVTIVHQGPGGETDQKSITVEESKKANLVATETTEPVKSPVRIKSLPRRLLFYFSFIALTILIIVLALIFTITPEIEGSEEDDDKEPNDYSQEYNITGHRYYTRNAWGGRPPLWVDELQGLVLWVIVSHTVTDQCKTFGECSNQMRFMQDMHVNDGSPNIGYNFVIGADANVYEGRGWFAKNFHRFGQNSLGISFTGNYVYDELTSDMLDVFSKLLSLGVDLRVLHPNFRIIAHNQTLATLSPGVNIYKELKKMPHFYIDMRPRDQTDEN